MSPSVNRRRSDDVACSLARRASLPSVPVNSTNGNARSHPAILFTIWSGFVGIIDNVLKPFLLGRGVQVPMIVIFVGAIGGLLTSGLIGLFVGPVVLALGYTLFLAWLDDRPQDRPAESGQDAPATGDADPR